MFSDKYGTDKEYIQLHLARKIFYERKYKRDLL